MAPDELQAWTLAQMASDLRSIRNIVVAWWWLVWIGATIAVVSAILSS